VIATDNGSDDGTIEILESYAQHGHLNLMHEQGENMDQGAWVTRMARLAAAEFDADWVINSDADEFWCSRRGSLKAILAQIPGRFATVRAFLRSFVPRPDDGHSFADRMTARLAPSELVPGSPFEAHPFHAQEKVVHRANPDVTVGAGNHDARWDGSDDLRGWIPIEVFHFPLRSAEQCRRKWRNWERHHYAGYEALHGGDPSEYFESRVVDDDALARGLADGWLVVDTRLRDVLSASDPAFPPPTLADDAAFAADVSSGSQRDTFVRASRRLEELERRITAVEDQPWRRTLRSRVR